MLQHCYPPAQRVVRRLVALVAVGALVAFPLFARTSAHAQQGQDTPVAPSAPASGPDLFDFIDDIDHLNVINPLHLSPDQLNRVIDLIKTAQGQYNDKVNALGASFTSKNGAEIRHVHEAALLGNSVSDEFITKVNDVLKQREQMQVDLVKTVTAGLQRILDQSQQTTIVTLAKKYAHSGNGSDEQWTNYYVLHVLMRYPRIVPMLSEARAAQERDRNANQSNQTGQ